MPQVDIPKELLRKQAHDLRERAKELDFILAFSDIVNKPGISLDEILQGIVELIPTSRQYPKISCARVTVEDKEFKTENFDETIWKETRDLNINGKRIGTVEIYYLQEIPDVHKKPFLQQQRRSLINVIAKRISRTIDRHWTFEKLKWQLQVDGALAKLYRPLASPSIAIDKIAMVILNQARKLTGSMHGYVSAINRITLDNISYTLTKMMGKDCKIAAEGQRIVFPRGDDGLYNGLWGHSLNTLEPFYTNYPETHPASKGLPVGHIPIKRFLSVPVILEQKLVGQISLANKGKDYTERDLEAICRLAEFYALAIQRRRTLKTLKEREATLENKTKELEETNIALRILLQNMDEDKKKIEENVVANIKELVIPYIERLKKDLLDAKQMTYLNIVESNLNDIISPFTFRLSSKYLRLTPAEIHVANLIKEGRTTKEIGEMLYLSPRTVEFHRQNIRKKIDITNRKANLKTHLLSV